MGRKIDESVLYEILEKLHVAVYIVDDDGILRYINSAAERLDRVSTERDVGRLLSDVWGATCMEKLNSPTLDALYNGVAHNYDNLEWRLLDGGIVNAITSSYPIIREGNIVGAFTLAEDIGSLKRHLIKQGAMGRKQIYRLKKGVLDNGTEYTFDDIIGSSEVMQNALALARKLAKKPLPVLIYGETGTGKEMFAQGIHNASNSAAEPFVAINCAAIPETLLESMLFGSVKGAFTGAGDRAGLFEKAGAGTIFLDEINSMPMLLQAKLLRAIQQKEMQRLGGNKTIKIKCRILSATNKEPQLAIEEGELREDLYYRLAMGVVWLPPLRERMEDINELTEFFIGKINEDMDSSIFGISDSLLQLFMAYKWSGNIRELSNVISNSAIMMPENAMILDVEHLPNFMVKTICEHFVVNETRAHSYNVTLPTGGSVDEMVDAYEEMLIRSALESTEGKMKTAAEKLKITRQSLYVKMKKYAIKKEDI